MPYSLTVHVVNTRLCACFC